MMLLCGGLFVGFVLCGVAWPGRTGRELAAGAKAATSAVVKNRDPLPASPLYPLPLTAVRPTGWLRQQLRIQANGLSGHLDEFWSDVGPNSGWLGGTGESWERGPYFLDGLVPLAYLLGDPQLIAKARKWVEWTLTHQRPDGSIGPERNKDWWPNMVMLKALTQYQEATGDPRVIPLMGRYFHYQTSRLAERPLHEWAKYRWADEVVSVLWLYNRTGDASLLDLARALQRQGYDWKGEFANFPFTARTTKQQLGLQAGLGNNDLAMSAHGVNNAMALKTSAVWGLVSRDLSDGKAALQQWRELDKYHLLPNGMFSCDEHLAGASPAQGTELCSVVETQFSLEQMISILGDPSLADRLERIAFNALPATFSADMWAHQYDQQPNQVLCSVQPRDWTSNGSESNVFGLEPNFGCCTANMHQGWPKFVASLWMASCDGLAAVAYGPSLVSTTVKNGVHLEIEEETDYPFRGEIHFTVNPAIPAVFALQLRVPGWADQPSIKVNGTPLEGVRAGEFHRIERQWNKEDKISLILPLPLRTSLWYQNSVAVERGPLVFALRIGEEWRKIDKGMSHPAKPPAADWEAGPTTPWNYALIIDPARAQASAEVVEKPVGEFPFSSAGAPVEVRIKGRRLPAWKLVNGSAAPPPPSPVSSQAPEETLTLIPYGCAKLRVTAFPRVNQ
jgi:hypothetical protein